MAIGNGNVINSNIGSLNALNALSDINRQLATSQLRLATGKRINGAEDDPAGYSIAHGFDQKARGLTVAMNSVGTAENVMGIAEGAMNNVNDILANMRDLVLQASSDTLGATERTAIGNQLTALNAEINRIGAQTTFNGTNLLDGTFTGKKFQTGDTATDNITVGIATKFDTSATGLNIASIDVSSAANAATALASVNAAIGTVTGAVQSVGSTTQRLQLVENNLGVSITNIKAAQSRIEDADVAQEQANSTRLQILRQLATAQLAQANSSPEAVLSLFR